MLNFQQKIFNAHRNDQLLKITTAKNLKIEHCALIIENF